MLHIIRHGNKKGGIIITMIEADDIMEPPAYLDSFKYDNLEDMEKALRKCFTIPFFVAFENLITATTHTIYFVTKPENFDIIRKKTPQIPVATVQEAWELAKKQLKKKAGRTTPSISSPTAAPSSLSWNNPTQKGQTFENLLFLMHEYES